jgi:hypothetical protein
MAHKPRLAVLIDGENVSGHLADALFEKIAEHGTARLRRIYGDFTNPCLKTWTGAVAKHAIIAQQVFKAGKNAADVTLIMDAAELLLSDRFDGFCIVSSDGDFTRLAERIREKGLTVIGFGNGKTKQDFRGSCSTFVCTENLPKGQAGSSPLPLRA